MTLRDQSHDKNLAASSRRFAERAFASYEQSDWVGFIVFANTAIELLAKAVLAKVNLLLVADEKNEKLLLKLALSDPRKGIPASVRTISADVAIRRTREIGVPFDRYAQDLKALREARNSLMHIGRYNSNELGSESFDAWVRSMVALTEHAGYPMDLVFGTNVELVEIQIGRYTSQLEVLFKQRIVAAKRCWREQQMDHEELQLRDLRLTTEFDEANAMDPSVQSLPCPVCDLPSRLYGDLELEPDYSFNGGEAYLTGAYHVFVPTGLHCQTCELDLDSRGLVEQSGVLDQWDISEDDIYRWDRELWEPDY